MSESQENTGKLSCLDQHDKSILYQITTEKTKYSHIISKLTKIKKGLGWQFPCYFSSQATRVHSFWDLVIVTLVDNVICFVDRDTGLFCLPSILVNGGIKYFAIIEEKFIVIVSYLGKISILKYTENNSLELLFEQFYYSDVSDMSKVIFTYELPDGMFSPIIIFPDRSVRWSWDANHWVEQRPNIPDILTPLIEFQTIFDIESQYMEALLLHDEEKVLRLFQCILSFYQRE